MTAEIEANELLINMPISIANANIKSLDLDLNFQNPNADDDINKLFSSLSTSSSAGPSGIDGNYIKQLNPHNQ